VVNREAARQSAKAGKYALSVQENTELATNALNVGGSEMYKQRIKQIKKQIGVPCYVMVTRFEGQFSDGSDGITFAVYVGIGVVYTNHETGTTLDGVIEESIFKAKVFLKSNAELTA
jgi:hypothetical protein